MHRHGGDVHVEVKQRDLALYREPAPPEVSMTIVGMGDESAIDESMRRVDSSARSVWLPVRSWPVDRVQTLSTAPGPTTPAMGATVVRFRPDHRSARMTNALARG
jgi:hypothetical protein